MLALVSEEWTHTIASESYARDIRNSQLIARALLQSGNVSWNKTKLSWAFEHKHKVKQKYLELSIFGFC